MIVTIIRVISLYLHTTDQEMIHSALGGRFRRGPGVLNVAALDYSD